MLKEADSDQKGELEGREQGTGGVRPVRANVYKGSLWDLVGSSQHNSHISRFYHLGKYFLFQRKIPFQEIGPVGTKKLWGDG